ncbi:transcriptional regulator, LacI family [Streptoalloteichus tenebrarius]|uniref:Transcriptional regulator, LacI family n=1 Tax=Streptoalloteichus tenebrarius (strain ATCC 17920 / DSM 40477 / JCM 4838 / CBS 697.72 / NBRC 16177 / NCIMB 11028 / NRRL B-12390 / A12253. 1 / ISP 5477) TaxID=1933 RepID=A0ABT1HQT3_STRSD|nr:LacI family DNA-binding transcriptional regulator [Streptoalloteichus tenebrarius]MCP2257867.1 transcriptional regulator, LacI family [Streptoalloteichus tenebrarius]BFE99770.1 LacI family DNA-binding transcriptional regulator [Streptoalloteichus tenebrarius]
MAARQTTLVQVAERAGVSLATASRVLNGGGRRVSAPLRERVLAAATVLGYRPNASAQALARNSSNLVGLVVHDIADPYFSSIAAGVTEVAERAGLVVVLGTTGRDPERERSLLATLRAHRARAVVLVGTRVADPVATERLAAEIRAFVAEGGRVTCVSQAGLPTDTVVPANRDGATALARRLTALGHRRFAVLAGPTTLLTATDRLAAFRAGLAEAGVALPDDAVVHGEFTRDGGHAAALELLSRRTGATCVFAVNDVMAVGAVAAFRERGVRVPEDVSVAGFDDIPTLRDLVPALSTVRLPLTEMGRCAAIMALDEPVGAGRPADHGDEHRTEHRHVPMPAEVVLRESTTAPGAGLP